MKEKLKPCPFCGSPDLEIGTLTGMFEERYYVYCRKCKVTGPLGKFTATKYNGVKSAIAIWNRRAKDEQGQDN